MVRFSEDGLKRSGKFENVITVVCVEKRTPTIMGEGRRYNNIELLRDVLGLLRTTNAGNINEDLSKIRGVLQYTEYPFFLTVPKTT